MKVFQIMNDKCHWDASRVHSSLAETVGRYAPNIVFVEAPDYVHEGELPRPQTTEDRLAALEAALNLLLSGVTE